MDYNQENLVIKVFLQLKKNRVRLMKKILITGGAGFVGSHLVDQIISNGDIAIVVDNLSTGNLNNLNEKAIFYKMDITNTDLSDVFKNEKPDYVYHLAAQSSVTASIEDPTYDANMNIMGTINILNLCKQYSIQKIIYASSAAVYGIPNYLGIDEKHPINPNSFYGISKYTSEQYVKTYSRLYGINYTILRYANIYGPRQNYIGEGGVIANFINKIILEDQPIIYGDGLQTRDFIFVKDVVAASLSALLNGDYKILNVGTGKAISIVDLLMLIIDLIGLNKKPINKEVRIGDIKESYFHTELVKTVLGWEPEFTLKEGLKETILYYQYLSEGKNNF